MNYIFIFLILISFICATINGTMDVLVQNLFASCKSAVEIALALIGIMGFWLGIVNIAKKSGLMDLFAKWIKKPLLLIFPEVKENNEAISNIALNISANALGLSNAATPFGIKAMENMQGENPDKQRPTNAMCTFLAINTAGFQLVPASVIAVLVATGATNPTEIILPTIGITLFGTIVAIITVKILQRFFPYEEVKK